MQYVQEYNLSAAERLLDEVVQWLLSPQWRNGCWLLSKALCQDPRWGPAGAQAEKQCSALGEGTAALQAAVAFVQLHFSSLFVPITDSVEKNTPKRMMLWSPCLSKKKSRQLQNYNDKATPHESQAHQPCQGCPWCCAGPGLSEGVPQWLPALADGEQDLRFHGPVCCLACSLAVLVITSIVDIFVVIWALPRYGLLALGGKTGKADEGSLWVLKWLCVCFVTREGKAQVFLSAAFNLMSSWMDIKQFTLFKVFFIVKEAF